MLLEQTREYISKLSDAKLFEYVLGSDYEPEAIEFARVELKRRNLDSQTASQLQVAAQEQVERRATEARERENRPLSASGKAVAFIVGAIFFWAMLIVGWAVLDAKTWNQKKRDWLRFGAYGFLTTMLVVMAIAIAAAAFNAKK